MMKTYTLCTFHKTVYFNISISISNNSWRNGRTYARNSFVQIDYDSFAVETRVSFSVVIKCICCKGNNEVLDVPSIDCFIL
jgi:hypothetical protein